MTERKPWKSYVWLILLAACFPVSVTNCGDGGKSSAGKITFTLSLSQSFPQGATIAARVLDSGGLEIGKKRFGSIEGEMVMNVEESGEGIVFIADTIDESDKVILQGRAEGISVPKGVKTDIGNVYMTPGEMIYLPSGTFNMGSNSGDSDEQPVHAVTLDSYFLDKFEVTNTQYSSFIEATGREKPVYFEEENFNGTDQPVVGVDWQDAQAFCQWAGKRLPSEAEWERAARGCDERIYPWGDEAPDCEITNLLGCLDRPADIGTYPSGASPFGIEDMAGNVSEWIKDYYDQGYYTFSPSSNPAGPSTGTSRIIKGGSFKGDSSELRASNRVPDPETYSNLDIGFRCAW